MIKGEDTKESWCRWSCQAERRRSSKHRNRDRGLRGVYRNSIVKGTAKWDLRLIKLKIKTKVLVKGGV